MRQAFVVLALVASLAGMCAADGLSTAFYFPDHPMKQFPAGEQVNVVVSAHNDGPKPLNLTAIVGSLGSTENYALQFQNFTPIIYYEPVAVGEEVSVEYKFVTLPMLAQGAPREFQVTLDLWYTDAEGGQFRNTFFNQTVEIVEPARLVDTELIFMCLTLAGVAAAIAYAVVSNYSDKFPGLAKATKKRTTKVKPQAFNEEEWVAGSNYDLHKRKRANSKRTVVATADADS